MSKKLFTTILLVLIATNGYAEDNLPAKIINPFGFLNAIFSPKLVTLTKFIDDANYTEADNYLASEYQYFLIDNKKENEEIILKLAKKLNDIHEPYLENSIEEISKITGDEKASEWSSNREIILSLIHI